MEHPHCVTLFKKGLALDGFAALPELQNTFTRFLDGEPLVNIDLVGIVERYTESLRLLYNFFDITLDPTTIQAHKNRNYARTKPQYDLDPGVRKAVEEINAIDMNLYHLACERFEMLLARYGGGY
jgi:hypothetical protein